MLLVTKRSGNSEPFDRNKVISGVRKACQGRPIKEDDLKMLGQRVEEDLRSRGLAEVRSEDVGKAILAPLKELDEVAYLRFASVYQIEGAHCRCVSDHPQSASPTAPASGGVRFVHCYGRSAGLAHLAGAYQ